VALGLDGDLFDAATNLLGRADTYDYSYLWSWLGVPIIQLPEDIIATQEAIWATKPDVIIETGVARGGSVLFMASILQLIGRGTVVGEIAVRERRKA
jgi:cephalosporin hydroxylase